MKKRTRESYDDDDGRVISSMENVGQPSWYSEKLSKKMTREDSEEKRPTDEIRLTPEEKRAMTGGVFAAAMLMAGVFALAGLLFILFCVFVWLR